MKAESTPGRDLSWVPREGWQHTYETESLGSPGLQEASPVLMKVYVELKLMNGCVMRPDRPVGSTVWLQVLVVIDLSQSGEREGNLRTKECIGGYPGRQKNPKRVSTSFIWGFRGAIPDFFSLMISSEAV